MREGEHCYFSSSRWAAKRVRSLSNAFQAIFRSVVRSVRAAIQGFNLRQGRDHRVEGRDRLNGGADDQVGQLAQRRGVDVGEQDDARTTGLGCIGHAQGLGLITAVVEQQDNVLALDVVQAVRQLSVVFQCMAAWAQQTQVTDQVAGQETAEASTEAKKAGDGYRVSAQPVRAHPQVGSGPGFLAGCDCSHPGTWSRSRPGEECARGCKRVTGERRRWSISLSNASWKSP